MLPLITQLLQESDTLRVSIVMPLLAGPSHGKENVRRLSCLLDEAKVYLEQKGISARGSSQFFASARDYAERELNIVPQESSLCMYFSPDVFIVRLLPVQEEQRVIVGSQFFVTPLLPFLYGTEHYAVLAVSQNSARFIDVHGDTAEVVAVREMPVMMDGTSGAHTSGMGQEQFHGKTAPGDNRESELTVYLLRIQHALEHALHKQYLPIVFAGVQELFGLYRKIDKSGFLSAEYIKGSPDRLSPGELAALARPIAGQAEVLRVGSLLAQADRAKGHGLLSSDLNVILQAAHSGKVEVLLVAQGSRLWGSFSPATGEVVLSDSAEDVQEELLGTAALHALRHRGHVAVVAKDAMPEGHDVVAVLRK